MFLGLFVLILLIVICTLWITNTSYNVAVCDLRNPFNLFIMQQPSGAYPESIITHRVGKPWQESRSETIPCRLVRNSHLPPDEVPLFIYSHGNAENILHCYTMVEEQSKMLEVDMITYDYSGYGANEPHAFERTPEGIELTLKSVYNYAVKTLGYNPANVYFMGYSLGSGPSTKLVADLCRDRAAVPPAGLVLLGAYSTMKGVVRDLANDFFADLMEERWNSMQNISRIPAETKVLLLHGENDRMILPRHARLLKESRPESTLVMIPNAGHITFDLSTICHEIREWMKPTTIHRETE